MSRLPIALSAVFLMGAGAWRAWAAGEDVVASALVAAGLVALGVWLGMESRR